MNTASPQQTRPETDARYWRGLEELVDTPEFREKLVEEFPQGAARLSEGFDRRDFVKLMSASLMLAGVGIFGVGCRRPEEEILPFATQPEGYVHGVPQYYATAMPTRTGAIPLVARSDDGRPTKVEGNARHPFSNGGTDIFAQASVLNLYDPDRLRHFSRGGNKVSRTEALDMLGETGRRFTESSGEGLAFLSESVVSPSRDRIKAELKNKFPNARWFQYEPVDATLPQRAATIANGRPVKPVYHLEKARVVLSLDSDFLSTEDGMELFSRGFAKSRRLSTPEDEISRLYVIEALMTLTGGAADHRLRVADSQIFKLAAQIGQKILAAAPVSGVSGLTDSLIRAGDGSDANAQAWIEGCVADLLRHKGEAVVLAGYRQPLAVHLIAYTLNMALGAYGNTIDLVPAPELADGSIAELAGELNAGSVDTLVILGGNPVYNAPAGIDWPEAQKRANTVLRFGYYNDETSLASTHVYPAVHYLESWGDARTGDGTYVPVQPLIQPLFGGITDLEFLARIGNLSTVRPHDIVRATFQSLIGGLFVENDWKKFLHDGYLSDSAADPVSAGVNSAVADQIAAGSSSAGEIEVLFYRDARVDDGRYTNNGWLQELPDPVTKVTWENVIAMSDATAKQLEVHPNNFRDHENMSVHGQSRVPLIRLSVGGQEVVGPLWVQPGMADGTIAVAIGYGRQAAGRIGNGSGFNAYPLRPTADTWRVSGASVTPEQPAYVIACTQSHWSMEGRPIVREANLNQYRENPDFASAMNGHTPPSVTINGETFGGNQSLYVNPLDKVKQNPNVVHQWGMAIDLNACTGCSACVIACQSENNIPIVGKDQVSRSREMHWMRIDRYYSGEVDRPMMLNQPMLCQHCEAAPCESVCPVNATVHDEEGLNVMAYNRCVGTRYCSNNCPYKVRRYNFFDYNKRPLSELVGPVYSSPLVSTTDGEWDLKRWWRNPAMSHMRPDDEWELLKLVKNPDVSVRMRGVMEKCSFCLQRIEGAKIAQKVKAGAGGDVAVPDGTLKTACQQACPAEAISFGNIADDHSEVSTWKHNSRNYSVLDLLLTKPRTTYLAKVRNMNPDMPDYVEMLPSTVRYAEENSVHGNPYEAHHGGHHDEDHHDENGSEGGAH